MPKKTNMINPISGEPMRKLSNVLVYGLTDEQLVFVNDNLPNRNICVTERQNLNKITIYKLREDIYSPL